MSEAAPVSPSPEQSPDFFKDLVKRLKNEALDPVHPEPAITPLTVFKILLETPSVQQMLTEKGLKAEPLREHVDNVIAARDAGQIKGKHGRFSLMPEDDALLNTAIDHGRDEARKEIAMKGRLGSKDPTGVTPFYYEEGVFEFISGYVASEKMNGITPTAEGLFKKALEQYGKDLGKPVETVLEKAFPPADKSGRNFQDLVRDAEKEIRRPS